MRACFGGLDRYGASLLLDSSKPLWLGAQGEPLAGQSSSFWVVRGGSAAGAACARRGRLAGAFVVFVLFVVRRRLRDAWRS